MGKLLFFWSNHVLMMMMVYRSHLAVCSYTCHQQRELWLYTHCRNGGVDDVWICAPELKTMPTCVGGGQAHVNMTLWKFQHAVLSVSLLLCVWMWACVCEGGVNAWNQSNTVISLLSAKKEGERARDAALCLLSAGFHDNNNHNQISIPVHFAPCVFCVSTYMCVKVILISWIVKLGIQI